MRLWFAATLIVIAGFSRLWAADSPAAGGLLDGHFVAAWKEAGIEPAPPVDDARYLRRIYLDIAGTLPPPARIREFLLDPSPDKRARAVAGLVESPEYAVRWANYWDAVLIGRTTESAVMDRTGFKTWLREGFAANRPWDAIVTDLLTAEGWNTKRQPANAASHPADQQERYQPAVNWFLRYWQSLPELSSATTKTFLGVQLQCAQCHDHKTEKWKQEDFRQFTAFFTKTWPTYYDRTLIVGTPRMEVRDRLFVPPTTGAMEQYFGSYQEYVGAKPKLPAGPEVGTFGSRRKALAKWVTAKDNPFFAKAIVNRMWALFLGQGFVEPIDDFRPGNPPMLPAALDALAADFTAHDFDLRHLIRTICASRPYQLACRAPGEREASASRLGNTAIDGATHLLWSRYPLKQLEVEVLLETVLQATGSEEFLGRISKGNVELIRGAFAQQFVTQLGTDDMIEVASFDETIPRALLMLNGPLFTGTSRMIDGLALDGIFGAQTDDRQRIEQLYLLTLSRLPSEGETRYWLKFVTAENKVVSSPGPVSDDIKVTGLTALMPSKEITSAPANAEFAELVKHAKTGADFKVLAGKMKNNADAGLYVRALREFSAEAPFRFLAQQAGGRTAKEQAYEDLHWALVNCSEFLTNH